LSEFIIIKTIFLNEPKDATEKWVVVAVGGAPSGIHANGAELRYDCIGVLFYFPSRSTHTGIGNLEIRRRKLLADSNVLLMGHFKGKSRVR
jgi:hypothetical protein